MSGGRFQLVPDPPQAGRPATVVYVGPATEIEWQIDGGPPTRVRPGPNGEFRISIPHGSILTLSDNLGLAGYLFRPIVDHSHK